MDAYVTYVQDYNDRITSARQTLEQDILAIDSKRSRNTSQAESLRMVNNCFLYILDYNIDIELVRSSSNHSNYWKELC